MPKNIYLIKENIPKIEEIREIKTEIPTYEEFLKTYKNEERLNYDELTHEDISTVKGYGPCSWNNPNCSCYESQGFIPLKIPCPVSEYSGSNITNWYHSNSGYLNASDQSGCGTLLISSQGHIKCANCGTSDRFDNWKFSNPQRPGIYMTTNSENFINALSISTNLFRDSSFVSKNVMSQLMMHLMRNSY